MTAFSITRTPDITFKFFKPDPPQPLLKVAKAKSYLPLSTHYKDKLNSNFHFKTMQNSIFKTHAIFISMQQLSFIAKALTQHGGSLQHRKVARTLDSKRPLHLVLKCKKQFQLLQNTKLLNSVLRKQAKTFAIKVYSTSLQRDHWHLCIKIPNRLLYRAFIRSLTGILARKLGKGLWRFLPYTRIVNWQRDFKNTLIYIFKNDLELMFPDSTPKGPP